MTREERANPLNRLPAAVFVRNRISRLDDERLKLVKLLELCESVESGRPLTSSQLDAVCQRQAINSGGRPHACAK